jgi:hypothetical protein
MDVATRPRRPNPAGDPRRARTTRSGWAFPNFLSPQISGEFCPRGLSRALLLEKSLTVAGQALLAGAANFPAIALQATESFQHVVCVGFYFRLAISYDVRAARRTFLINARSKPLRW